MRPILLIAAAVLGTLVAGSASARDKCNVPVAEWQPRESLQQKLEAQGWKVERIKTDDGCYEAYGFNDRGRRVEAYFNPKTFEVVRLKVED